MLNNGTRQLLVDLATGTTRPASLDIPTFSSASGPWTEIVIEQHRTGGFFENPGLASTAHLVMVHQGRPVTVQWESDRQAREITLQPEQAVFIPALLPHYLRTDDIGEFVALTINPHAVRRIAHEIVADPARITWRPALPFEEPLPRAIVTALWEEAKTGYQGGPGYAEALTHALAVHLVHHFSDNPPLRNPSAHGLARRPLRRALDFVQANLGAAVSLDDLAREAGLSRFHFARMFKQSTGVSPHQYVLQCRLERARSLLLRRDQTITAIAMETGFCDQSHFVSQFKRAYGVTPNTFRRSQI